MHICNYSIVVIVPRNLLLHSLAPLINSISSALTSLFYTDQPVVLNLNFTLGCVCVCGYLARASAICVHLRNAPGQFICFCYQIKQLDLLACWRKFHFDTTLHLVLIYYTSDTVLAYSLMVSIDNKRSTWEAIIKWVSCYQQGSLRCFRAEHSLHRRPTGTWIITLAIKMS